MSLTETYKAYLLNRESKVIQNAMTELLLQSGYILESWLISQYFNSGKNNVTIKIDSCIWSGRKAWISSELPVKASPGDIWMDIIEMTPMILIPTPPDEVADWSKELLARYKNDTSLGWISLRPVANWQFSTFLKLGVREVYDSQVAPPFVVMDSDRIINGNKFFDNIVNATREECNIYASWFNKMIPSPIDWEYAYEFLTQNEFDSLWGECKKEWIIYFINESTSVMCTPETFLFDISDGLESEDICSVNLAETLICNEWEFFDGVTFRTSVSTQLGLIKEWRSSLDIGDIQFTQCYNR